MRSRNVSEYMLVLAVCLVITVIHLTKPLGMQASIFDACPKPG